MKKIVENSKLKNQLKDMQKAHRDYNKRHPRSYFTLNPNAGDVPLNNAIFNHMSSFGGSDSDASGASSDAGVGDAGACCESLLTEANDKRFSLKNKLFLPANGVAFFTRDGSIIKKLTQELSVASASASSNVIDALARLRSNSEANNFIVFKSKQPIFDSLSNSDALILKYKVLKTKSSDPEKSTDASVEIFNQRELDKTETDLQVLKRVINSLSDADVTYKIVERADEKAIVYDSFDFIHRVVVHKRFYRDVKSVIDVSKEFDDVNKALTDNSVFIAICQKCLDMTDDSSFYEVVNKSTKSVLFNSSRPLEYEKIARNLTDKAGNPLVVEEEPKEASTTEPETKSDTSTAETETERDTSTAETGSTADDSDAIDEAQFKVYSVSGADKKDVTTSFPDAKTLATDPSVKKRLCQMLINMTTDSLYYRLEDTSKDEKHKLVFSSNHPEKYNIKGLKDKAGNDIVKDKAQTITLVSSDGKEVKVSGKTTDDLAALLGTLKGSGFKVKK